MVGTIVVNDIEKIETKIVAKIVPNEEMEDQENQKVRRKNQLELDRQILLDLHPRPTLKNILDDKFKLSKEKTDHQHQRNDHLHR